MSSYNWPPEGGSGGGVTSLNAETGDIILVAGTGITITPSGQNITIASTDLAAAITSINSDTTAAQTLTVGTAGVDFAIVDAGSGSHVFNLPTASASNRGALSSADWSTFNGKQSALTLGNLTSTPTTNLVVTGGTGAVVGSGVLLTLTGASLIESTSSVLTITGASNAVLGTGVTIQVNQASTSQSGYLSSTDWNTFNGKGAGTVTAVSVTSTNGFAGSSSGGATPALTLSTTINSPVLAGNGTAISAATITGTGSTVVLATAPTMTNPVVGTQSQGDTSTKAASTAYVDTAVANAVAGINPAVAVQAATTAAANTSGFTYNNGVSGVGATFTGTTNTAVVIDGFTFTALGQRLLVKNDTQSPSGAFNGIYSVTQLQTGILPPILTRALDYDTPSDINNTGAIPVVNGTINGTTSWVQTAQVVTVGTTPLVFVQFSVNPSTILTNPMTTLGDIIYENATPAPARLAGNITTTAQFLSQTGTGSVSAAPAWTTAIPVANGGTGNTSGGMIGTNTVAYTATITGFGTTTGGGQFWRRSGDMLHVSGAFLCGTATATLASVSLPAGLVIDSATPKINAGVTVIGPAGIGANGAVPLVVLASPASSTSVVYFGYGNASNAALTPQNGNNMSPGAGQAIAFSFDVPISGWNWNS